MKWHFNMLTALALVLALLVWFTPFDDPDDDCGRDAPGVGQFSR